MDICKFFREGYCRYGSRCRYLHQSSNNYSYGYSDNNYGKYYGDDYNTKSRQQKGYSGGSSNNSNYNYRSDNSDQRYKGGTSNNSANQNAYDLWTLIEKELKILEEGHQWPLTCFSVSREYGNVPGWADHSPEELRYEMYKAIKEGTFDQCKNSISQLYKNAEERRNDFKSKARALPIVEALIRFRDSPENSNTVASSQEQNTNLWQNRVANQQSTSLFGGNSSSTQQPTGIFGGNSATTQQTTGIFGGNSSSTQQTTRLFGGNSSTAQQTTGIFVGNGSSTQQPTSIFGGNSGSTQQATGIFGGSNSSSQQSTGIFGGNSSSTQQSTGIFGGNSSSTQIQQGIFGNTQFSNPGETYSFSMTQEQQHQAQLNSSSNSFMSGANAASTPMFQSALPAASPFQTQVTQNNTSFFQPMAQQSPQMTASPFNQPVSSSQSVFKSSSDMNDHMNYSQQTDLTDSELSVFQSKSFKFGQIPLKPPLKELC